MIKKFVMVGMVLMLAACGSGGGETGSTTSGSTTGTTSNSTSYFPLTVGSKWTSITSDQVTWTTEVLPDGRTKNVESGNPIQNATTYSTWTSDNTGVYSVKAEDVTNNITWTYSQPGLYYPSNLTSGAVTSSNYAYSRTSPSGSSSETGTIKITVLGAESVTVPAGTFNAVKIRKDQTYTSGGSTKTTYSWLAAGVGPVQNADDKGVVNSKLTSYSIK